MQWARTLVAEDPDALLLAPSDGVGSSRVVRHLGGGGPLLVEPELAAAVEDPAVGVSEEFECPEGIARPPVRLVTVEHDGGVAGDAGPGAQGGELLGVDVVAEQLVLEVPLPVDPDGAGDVGQVVEQYVFVALDDADFRILQVVFDPIGRDQHFRVNVGFSHGVRPPC